MADGVERAIGEDGLANAIDRFEAAIAAGVPDPAIPLAEALGWIYSLEEWHRKRLHKVGQDYYVIRARTTDGEVTAALIFARNAVAHELTRVGRLIRLGGLPAPLPMAFGDAGEEWTWAARMNVGEEDRRGRHLLYEKHLQGRPIVSSLKAAARFFRHLGDEV